MTKIVIETKEDLTYREAKKLVRKLHKADLDNQIQGYKPKELKGGQAK